jgi:hypothetical protein
VGNPLEWWQSVLPTLSLKQMNFLAFEFLGFLGLSLPVAGQIGKFLGLCSLSVAARRDEGMSTHMEAFHSHLRLLKKEATQ